MASDFGTITIKLDPEVKETLDRISNLLESDAIKELLRRLESMDGKRPTVKEMIENGELVLVPEDPVDDVPLTTLDDESETGLTNEELR